MSCFACFGAAPDVGAAKAASRKGSGALDGDDLKKHGCSASAESTRRGQVSMSGDLLFRSSKQHPKVAESLEALQQAGLPAPMNVSWCEPAELVKDVHELRWVGQGSQGVVYEGIWQGAVVAVKWSIAEQLDTGACELLFSRLLGHPNVVQTYDAKVAILDSQIFEQDASTSSSSSAMQSSGGSSGNNERPGHNTPGPATIMESTDMNDARTDSYKSEEGFGNPFGRNSSFTDVRDMLRLIGAKPGQCITQMIMEYCDQGSLLTAISRGIFLPTSRFGNKVALRALFRTAREISQGMVHLHQVHVVHGDLKPANVLLMNSRKDRRGFIAKISDFGLAQYCPASRGVVENAPWGTLVFMAPERFCTNRLEPASDVWSLGVLMWQMYTARLPYEGTTQAKLLQGISAGTLHLTWPPGSPASLVNLVASCMARHPQQRPTFEALIHQLASLESDVRMEGYRLSNSIEIQRGGRPSEEKSNWKSNEGHPLRKQGSSSKTTQSGQLDCHTSPTESPTIPVGRAEGGWTPNQLSSKTSTGAAPSTASAATAERMSSRHGNGKQASVAAVPTAHINLPASAQAQLAASQLQHSAFQSTQQGQNRQSPTGQGLNARSATCGGAPTTSALLNTSNNSTECSAQSMGWSAAGGTTPGMRTSRRNSSIGPSAQGGMWVGSAISEASGIDDPRSSQTDNSMSTGASRVQMDRRAINASSLDVAMGSSAGGAALVTPDADPNVAKFRRASQQQEALGSWSSANPAPGQGLTSEDMDVQTTGRGVTGSQQIGSGWGSPAQSKRAQVMSRLRYTSPDGEGQVLA